MANGKVAYTSSWYLITDVFPIFCEGIFYWIGVEQDKQIPHDQEHVNNISVRPV